MMGIILVAFFLFLILFFFLYIVLLIHVFQSSTPWGIFSLLFPPALIYYSYRVNDRHKTLANYVIWSGLFLLIPGFFVFLLAFYIHVSSNGHAADRTQSVIMQDHFQPIHEALLQYKDVHGSFPTTEEGLSVLPTAYFPEHKPAWDTRLETEFGPIIYTLNSPEEYTLLIPTTESIGLWVDIDFTHRVSEDNAPRDESRY